MSAGRRSPQDELFRRAPRPSALARLIPVSARVRRYRGGTARKDLLAGLTVAALAIPSAMAYAAVAGLDPVHGLYALILPMAAYALLGSSRHLIVGPEGSISALAGAAVLALAVAGSEEAAALAALLALLVAGFYLVALVLRLGWLADYLSLPVLIGYIHGIVVVLIVGQLGKLFGIDVDATAPVEQIGELVRGAGSAHAATALVGAVSLAALLLIRRFAPRAPGALIVVVAAIAASAALDLAAHGVAVVGEVPSGLPELALPAVDWSDAWELLPAAAGLFFVSFADGILTARAYAQRAGDRVETEQELRALGAANAFAGVSQAFPVGASGSRTAVNFQLRAASQAAGLVAAALVCVILLFATGPIEDLPKAVLGAAIVAAALSLVDRAAWRTLAREDRVELVIAGVAAAGVVVIGVLPAVALAVGLTIVDVVRRSAEAGDAVLGWEPELGRFADAARHPGAELVPGVVVYRPEDRIFFANAGRFTERANEALRGSPTEPHTLVICADGISHIDSSGMRALAALIDDLAGRGVQVRIARMRGRIQDRLTDAGVAERLGGAHFHPTVRAAVTAATGEEAR